VSEFHTKAPQATASEGLAQGPYVAARAGFKPTTLWTKGDKSTNESPHPTIHSLPENEYHKYYNNSIQYKLRKLPVYDAEVTSSI